MAEQGLGLLDIGDDAQAPFVEGRAIMGGRHFSRRPMQQPGADAPLQLRDRRRDRRARQPERVGRPRKARALDDAGENAEEIDAVQDWAPIVRRS
ncbi:hypothetical protein ACVWW1_008096 [Bradyrhizobium sp. JR3.5]